MEIPDAFSSRFCVYGHFVEGDCVYVGAGLIDRAFSYRRSETWHAAVDGRPVTVRIFGRYDDRAEAFEIERALIRQLQPTANIIGTPANKRQHCRIRHVESGEIFPNGAAAARAFGLSQGSVSNVVNGRYASVGGHRFERVNPPPIPIFHACPVGGTSNI